MRWLTVTFKSRSATLLGALSMKAFGRLIVAIIPLMLTRQALSQAIAGSPRTRTTLWAAR
jgi:hypothetical protein